MLLRSHIQTGENRQATSAAVELLNFEPFEALSEICELQNNSGRVAMKIDDVSSMPTLTKAKVGIT